MIGSSVIYHKQTTSINKNEDNHPSESWNVKLQNLTGIFYNNKIGI